MKDRSPKPTVKVEPLETSLVTRLVTVLADSIKTATDTAGALIAFATGAAKLKLPAEVPEAHVSQLADELAVTLKWNGTAREKVNKSEARAIIRQHSQIPELITAMRSSYGKCGYHDAVQVCRLLPKCDNDLTKAVKQFGAVKAAGKPSDPRANAQRAIKALYASVRDSRKTDKRANQLKLISEFASQMDFELGIEA
jgi:hypothetical protein